MRPRLVLSGGGYIVHETADVGEAVAEACRVRPHLVILGRSLPEETETALCRAIRAESSVSGTPVLIMSRRAPGRCGAGRLDAGADDYVLHDSPQLILARVRRLIHDRKMAGLAMLDRQLVQVGRLLAGIVHEIRGPALRHP